jgi:hypothetical protein
MYCACGPPRCPHGCMEYDGGALKLTRLVPSIVYTRKVGAAARRARGVDFLVYIARPLVRT